MSLLLAGALLLALAAPVAGQAACTSFTVLNMSTSFAYGTGRVTNYTNLNGLNSDTYPLNDDDGGGNCGSIDMSFRRGFIVSPVDPNAWPRVLTTITFETPRTDIYIVSLHEEAGHDIAVAGGKVIAVPGCHSSSSGGGGAYYWVTLNEPSRYFHFRDIGAGDGGSGVSFMLAECATLPALRPRLECGDVITDTATTSVSGTESYHYFPVVVADATPNITFSTCGSRDPRSSVEGLPWQLHDSVLGTGTHLRLLRELPGGGYDSIAGCNNCGDCGGSAALGFYPYNATHLRPHFHEQVFELGLMSGIDPEAASFCTSGQRQRFELGGLDEGYRSVSGPDLNLSACANHPLVLENYGYIIDIDCLRNLSATCSCEYITTTFARPGVAVMRSLSGHDESWGQSGQPNGSFDVYCEHDRNVEAWLQASFVHPSLDERFCTTGSTRRFRAGHPGDDDYYDTQLPNQMYVSDPQGGKGGVTGGAVSMTLADCLGNITSMAQSGTPIYAWGMSSHVFDTEEACTDTVAGGAVDSAGNTCTAYVDYSCHGEAIDLTTLSSPYTGTTVDAGYERVTSCERQRQRPDLGNAGGPQASGTERILFVAIEPGGSISVRKQYPSPNGHRFYMETRWGGACPGAQSFDCTNQFNETAHRWTNDQATAQIFYIMVENADAESGAFELEWNITGGGTNMPATPACSSLDDADFNATASCCSCGGGGTVVEHPAAVPGVCYYYTEPFLPQDQNHEDDDHDDYSEFLVYCETDLNIGALDDSIIPAGDYILEIVTGSWNASDGDAFRLEMTCDTLAPTPSPTMSPTFVGQAACTSFTVLNMSTSKAPMLRSVSQ